MTPGGYASIGASSRPVWSGWGSSDSGSALVLEVAQLMIEHVEGGWSRAAQFPRHLDELLLGYSGLPGPPGMQIQTERAAVERDQFLGGSTASCSL
jgi:hypothetical protein